MSDDAPSDDEPRDDGPADAGEDGLPDDGLTPGRFREVVERLGSSVVTASQVARVLDVTQAEANDALDALADAGRVARLDVSDDPVVWFPRDLDSWADREHVVAFPDRREIVVEHPAQFTRAQLAQFAHLVDANREEGYLYRVREADVWGAPHETFEGLERTMRQALGGAQGALAVQVLAEIRVIGRRKARAAPICACGTSEGYRACLLA